MTARDDDTAAQVAGKAFAAALETLTHKERDDVREMLATSTSPLANAIATEWWQRTGEGFAYQIARAVESDTAPDVSDLPEIFPFDVLRVAVDLVIANGVAPRDLCRAFTLKRHYVENGGMPEWRNELEAAAGCRLPGRPLEHPEWRKEYQPDVLAKGAANGDPIARSWLDQPDALAAMVR
jgi:hypothetical protein